MVSVLVSVPHTQEPSIFLYCVFSNYSLQGGRNDRSDASLQLDLRVGDQRRRALSGKRRKTGRVMLECGCVVLGLMVFIFPKYNSEPAYPDRQEKNASPWLQSAASLMLDTPRRLRSQCPLCSRCATNLLFVVADFPGASSEMISHT